MKTQTIFTVFAIILLQLALSSCSESISTSCGGAPDIAEADLRPKANAFTGCSDIPEETLLLFSPQADDQCLRVSSGTLSRVPCDIYDKDQWWSKAAAPTNQIKHFASRQCLTHDGPAGGQSASSFRLTTCTPAASVNIDDICQNSPRGKFFRGLGLPLFSVSFLSCKGKSIPLKLDQAALTAVDRDDDSTSVSLTLSSSLSSHVLKASMLRSPEGEVSLLSLGLKQNNFSLCRIENKNITMRNIIKDGKTTLTTPEALNCGGGRTLELELSRRQINSAAKESARPLFASAHTTISQDGLSATLVGTYLTSSGEHLLDFILKNPNIQTLTLSDIPGSGDDEGLAHYAPFIRIAGFNTYLPADGMIVSGGVDLFLTGVTRTVERGGFVGVHSWSGGGMTGYDIIDDRTNPSHKAYIDYTTKMLGDIGEDFYFFTLKGADPLDGTVICKMTTDQMGYFNLATTVTNANPPVEDRDIAINRLSDPFCLHFFSFNSLTSTGQGTANSTPTFSWSGQTYTGFTLQRYEVAIGTTTGGTDIQDWTSVSLDTTYQQTGLSLPSGDYYFSVRAVSSGTGYETLTSTAWQVP
ncbi:MAG: hypothetical protein OXB88_05415 [Bacteriovoracales bacterium]|nr:hypothetical protein [Bacteriovoracales bacterium]